MIRSMNFFKKHFFGFSRDINRTMKKYAFLFLVISSVSVYSCSKDNDDPMPDATGYWGGTAGEITVQALMSMINHPDGTGRIYFSSSSSVDTTTTTIKLKGKWKMTDGIFYGTYIGPLRSITSSDTIRMQGYIYKSPLIELRGVAWVNQNIGASSFRVIREE
jgi:hypothetical protein